MTLTTTSPRTAALKPPMSPSADAVTSARSARVATLSRAVALRAAVTRLAAEHAGLAPGLVLAVTVRCSHDLQRAGCTDERYPEALERLVRAVLMSRLA